MRVKFDKILGVVREGEPLSASPEDLATEVAARIAGDNALSARTTILENNEFKVLYYATINSGSGQITIPTNATVILDDFPQGLDAVPETIINGKPSGISPRTAGSVIVTANSFDTAGNYTLSGTPSAFPIALLYVLKIKAINYSNLNKDNIIEAQIVDAASISYVDTGLALKEDTSNKKTTMTGNESSNVFLLSTKGIYDWGTGLFQLALDQFSTIASLPTTLDISHANKWVRVTSATSGNLTVPANASVAYPIGTKIYVRQSGTGQVTLVPDTGVTLNAPSAVLTTGSQYDVIRMVKQATDSWLVEVGAASWYTAKRDISDGFPGLTLFKINFRNAANTFTSFFTNSNTAARTYTFPDADGNVVIDSAIQALTNKTGNISQWTNDSGYLVTPTWTDFSSTINPQGFSSVTVNRAQYFEIGKTVIYQIYIVGVSNSSAFTITLHAAAANTVQQFFMLSGTNNGVGIVSLFRTTANSTTASFLNGAAGGTWTGSGNKAINGILIFERT